MAFLLEYMQQGRQVTEQVLDLTPAQSRMLESYVSMNLQPENRSYRYNYIYDNCATRPLKLIEAAVGTQISLPDDGTFIYGDTGIADDLAEVGHTAPLGCRPPPLLLARQEPEVADIRNEHRRKQPSPKDHR